MSQVLRCDDTIAAGLLVCGNSGIGVPAEDIPGTGEDGASPLYNDLSFPTDDGKHVRMLITSFPASGTLECDEYGRLKHTDNDGETTADYSLYVDGALIGSTTITLTIGGGAIDLVIADLEVTPELDNLVLTRERTLAVQDLQVTPELDNLTLTRERTLAIADLQVTPELDNVVVVVPVGIDLAVADLDVTPEFDNVSIARNVGLNVADLEVSPQPENVSVGKTTGLIIADLEVSPELDNVTVEISSGISLTIQDVEVTTELTGTVMVGRSRSIQIADIQVQPELSEADVGLSITLAINDMEVSPELDNVMLSFPGSTVYGSTNNVMILTPETQVMTLA